jgi:hypothetical protein
MQHTEFIKSILSIVRVPILIPSWKPICAQINGYKKADERIRQFANSSAANALHNMLEQIDKRIAANKDYIKVYYIAKEAQGYSSK